MKNSKLAVVMLALVVTNLLAQSNTQSGSGPRDELFQATVQVVAFEARGSFIGTPEVRIFESTDTHQNLSGTFHDGIADHVPFGIYKIDAHLGGFDAEVRYVPVYRKSVTIVVGLLLGREKLVWPTPPSFHGKIIGALPQGKKNFVKLIGVYSNHSLESDIAADGGFDFSIPWDGKYQLLVINEDGVLASRTVSSPYSGPSLEILLGSESGTAH